MNKRIRRIIAITLILGGFSAVIPSEFFSVMLTKAYASSKEDYGIDDLEIRKGNLSSDDDGDDAKITMYTSSDYDNSTSFERSDYDYYVRTSASSINIKISKVDGCIYKIFKSGSSKAYSSSDDLDLKSGSNTFYVRTYESGDFNEKKVEENQIRCYTIHVEKKTSSSIYLKGISLSEGTISFSKNTLSYNVEVDSDVDAIKITADPEDMDNTVVIDGSELSDNQNFKKNVSLNKGKNSIKVEVKDDSDNSKTYTLNIYRGTKPEAVNSTVEYGAIDYNQPAVYLDNLQLNNGDIKLDFKKNVSVYKVKVDSSVDEVNVVATPDESNYAVEINNKKMTSDKDYEATLTNLNTGENAFTIKVTDKDGNSRKYTLNIYRGVNIPSNNTNTNTTKTTVEVKKNQWVLENNKWYFLDESGNHKTGWYKNNAGVWYLLGDDGAMITGWKNVQDSWYYFEPVNGAMITGWFKDTTGTWYYADENGHMLHDTVIGGYKLSSSGALV